MASFCLPKKYSKALQEALANGTISTAQLRDMTSAGRREALAKIVGTDTAKEVNALFESKLLLQNQTQGLLDWLKSIKDISESTRKSIIDQILNLGKVLQHVDKDSFLEDLVEKRLGSQITSEQATQLINAAKKAADAREAWEQELKNTDLKKLNPKNAPEAMFAYGKSLIDLKNLVESMKSGGKSFYQHVWEAATLLPKVFQTGIGHLSGPGVQGWGMISSNRYRQAFVEMFKYFGNEENYQRLNAYIIAHPYFDLAKDGKLGLTNLSDKVNLREEAIQTSLLEQGNAWLKEQTGIPNTVRASSRAFTGYLNYIRFTRFTDIINASKMAGEDVSLGSKAIESASRAVNNFTGRGHIGVGDKYGNVAPALNTVFYSSRKLSATINMFNPYTYITMTPVARKAAMGQLLGSLAVTATIVTIAKEMGYKTDYDPHSQDFLKVITPDGEKFDITGGNAIYGRLIARILPKVMINGHNLGGGYETTSAGKNIDLDSDNFDATNRADLIMNFFRDKLNPSMGFLTDALVGSDPVGRPFDVPQEVLDKFSPIVAKNYIDFFMYNGHDTAAYFPAVAGAFGVGMESPLPPPAKEGLSVWGEPQSSVYNAPDPLDKELKDLGYTPRFPPSSINGIKLNTAQYKSYIAMTGTLARSQIMSYVDTPNWSTIPSTIQLSMLKHAFAQSRKLAQGVIIAESSGQGNNDILQQSIAKKLQGLVK